VGRLRLGELARRVIKSWFEDAIGAKTVGLSHGDFSLVVQAFHDAAGEQSLSAEIVEDEFAVCA